MTNNMSQLAVLKIVKRPEWQIVLSQGSTYFTLTILHIQRLTLIDMPGSDMFERLSSYDHQRAYKRRARRKLEHTTKWILKHPKFEAWLNDKAPRCLWL